MLWAMDAGIGHDDAKKFYKLPALPNLADSLPTGNDLEGMHELVLKAGHACCLLKLLHLAIGTPIVTGFVCTRGYSVQQECAASVQAASVSKRTFEAPVSVVSCRRVLVVNVVLVPSSWTCRSEREESE